jgi:hypothetical protein
MDNSAADLLKTARVEVSAGTYFIVSLSHEAWQQVVAKPEVSPRMTGPFALMFDRFEVTMMLDEEDFRRMQPELASARVERNYRLITFDIELDLNIVGFLAEITKILAEAQIPVFVLSAFTRDHILVKQADLGPALKALGPYVSELC